MSLFRRLQNNAYSTIFMRAAVAVLILTPFYLAADAQNTSSSGTSSATGQTSSMGVSGNLQWLAERAKKNGQTNITISHIPENNGLLPLKPLLHTSHIVDGQVESSTVESDDYNIFTWYRVKVLSQGPPAHRWRGAVQDGNNPPLVGSVGRDEMLPPSISPARTGEILVRLYGGTIVIDGVSITKTGDFPLRAGGRYLFFLEPLSLRRSSDTVFVEPYQTEPLELDGNGLLTQASTSRFSHRMGQFKSSQDVVDYAK